MIDLVITGPDMSGTSTQIKGLIKHFQDNNYTVRDLRGTELDALFHAKDFYAFNSIYDSLSTYKQIHGEKRTLNLLGKLASRLQGYDVGDSLKVASMLDNQITSYINPYSADVWIMEEPTKRGSGQVNRVIEQYREKFNSKMNPPAATLSHQNYRTDEFLRFRGPLRARNATIIRSRSEETGLTYQLYDEELLPNGPSKHEFFDLPGHDVAFSNPPTHIFVVCGPANWTVQDYFELRRKRGGTRILDGYELNARLQVLANKRYVGTWLEEHYDEACSKYGSKPPRILRFDIYNEPDEMMMRMALEVDDILHGVEVRK